VLIYREQTSLAQMAALGVLVLGIVAVKVTSGH
jgi:multidrug transporter EmrE-like cation transporter